MTKCQLFRFLFKCLRAVVVILYKNFLPRRSLAYVFHHQLRCWQRSRRLSAIVQFYYYKHNFFWQTFQLHFVTMRVYCICVIVIVLQPRNKFIAISRVKIHFARAMTATNIYTAMMMMMLTNWHWKKLTKRLHM